jgi:hydrogenase expression/formation protein HypC
MCLAIPGRILSLSENSAERLGRIDFSGVVKETSLAFTPEAQVGDYVIVHAGFAISQLDEDEAEAALAEFALLEAMERTEADSP